MLLMLPREATLPAGRFTEYPLSSPNFPKPRRLFQRRERKPWHRGPKELLFVGDEGVTRVRHGWDTFKAGYSANSAGSRLTSGLGSSRYDFYRVALDEFVARHAARLVEWMGSKGSG